MQDKVVPFVTPSISAAAVNARGELWISLSVPYTYVYDKDGDKIRTVQFQAAGLINPTSLSFARMAVCSSRRGATSSIRADVSVVSTRSSWARTR